MISEIAQGESGGIALVELDSSISVTVRGCPTPPDLLVTTPSGAADYTIT
jgi:hypothetical protein